VVFDYNKKYADCLDRYIVYRSGRQVGKTMTTAIKSIHFAFFAPLLLNTVTNECVILIVAPTQDQAKIMYERIRTLITSSDLLSGFIIKNTQAELCVRWLNDQGVTRIATKATGETGSSVRGYSPHVIIVDECSFIKEEILRALFPAGAATRARIWLTSTPFSKQGYFYKACNNSKTLNGKDVKSDGQWTQFHVRSYDNPMIKEDPQYLKFLEAMTQEQYALEVEGEFLDIGNALIPHEDLLNALDNYKPIGSVRRYMGVDIARTGRDETVYCIIEVDRNDIARVCHWEFEGQSNVVDVAGRMEELGEKWDVELTYVDETGLGGGLIDLAQERSLPIRGQMFSLHEKAEMYKDLRLIFEKGRIRNIGQKAVEQLSMMSREYTETGIMKVKSEGKDDYADALALVCKSIAQGDQWHVLTMTKEYQDAMFG
jgi:phage terminase large subunit-like protein